MAPVWDTAINGTRQGLNRAAPVFVLAIRVIPRALPVTLRPLPQVSALTGRVTDVRAGDTVTVTLDIVARVEAATHDIASMLIHRVIQ